MKRTAKIFVALALLFAGGVFAQSAEEIKPIASKCTLKNGVVRCSIAQSDLKATLNGAGYADPDIKTEWSTFVSDLEGQMNPYVGDENSLYLTFETDIDLGGYLESEKRCYGYGTSFEPINFHTLFKNVVIDGGGHTIKNYCDISYEVNPSFFRKIKTDVTVKDLAFDNAYVLAKTQYKARLTASIVADAVEFENIKNPPKAKAVFENVKVTNSKVYGWNAGAVLGTASCNSSGGCPETKFSGVKVENVEVGVVEEYFKESADFTTGDHSAWKSFNSNFGGLAASLESFATFVNDTVLKLTIPDSVPHFLPDYSGNSFAGGLVAYVKGNIVGFDQDTVNATLNGSAVGGLVGGVSPGINSGLTVFQVSNSNVILNSGSYYGNNIHRYLGGLIGWLEWDSGNVLLSNNMVNVSSKNEQNGVGSANADLGGLVGYYHVLGSSAINLSVEGNHVEAEFETTEQNPDIGGILGLVRVESPNSKVSLKNNEVKAEVSSSGKYLYAGGLLGYASFGENKDSLLIEKNDINAEINTSGLHLRIGGVVGHSLFDGDNSLLSVQGTTVNPKSTNGSLINVSATSLNDADIAGVIGFVQNTYDDGMVSAFENHVQGNVNVATTTVSDYSGVGGILGRAMVEKVEVVGNVIKNDLIAPKNGSFVDKFFLGFVAGTVSVFKSIVMANNYHYGTTDVNAAWAVGSLDGSGGDYTSVLKEADVTEIGDVDCFVRNNYRNAIENLPAEGELALDGSGLMVSGDDEFYNGVISEEDMMSRVFTHALNAPTPAGSKVLWDNKPSSLPDFSEQVTVFRLAISLLKEDYEELKDEDKVALKKYLPVKQCEAGLCSLYVYTESDSELVSGLRYVFDGLKAGFMLIDKITADNTYGVFNFSQKFTEDKTVIGVTDREINVEYTMTNLDGPGYVPVDKYVDHLTFVWPRVDKIRLISGTGAVPVILLDTDDANGNTPEYELNFDFAENPCKEGVTDAQCVPMATYSSSTKILKKMDAFEDVLRNIRRGFNSIHQNKIVLKYLPIDLSENNGYLPHIEVGVLKGEFKDRVLDLDAKINMTTYAYDGKGELKEKDSFKIKKEQSNVDMVSRYQFSFAEQGFKVKDWWVDFWIDLDATSTDEIKACYNEGDVPARCVEPQLKSYGDSTKNYFNGVSDIENQLTGIKAGEISITHPLVKWSTKLDANDKLDLDSLIRGLASVGFKNDPEKPRAVFMGVRPRLESVRSYTVNFDVNADGKNVFFTDEFVIGDSYSRENGETAKLPGGILATNACFNGWDDGQISAMGAKHYTSLDGDLLERANPNDKGTFALYGNWVPTSLENGGCKVKTAEVVLKVVDKTFAEVDYGTVALWQSYQKLGEENVTFKHEFNGGKLEVPASDDVSMTLHVTPTQDNKDYDLAQLMLVAPDESETAIPFTTEDTSFKFKPKNGETYTLYAVFAGYIDVRLDSLRDDEYVSVSDSKAINDKKLHLVETGTTSFPKWVYTTTECVLGWSVKPDGANYDRGVIASDDLIAKLTSDKTLYAVWKNADVCVEKAGYRRLKLESEHGTVEIAEINTVNGSVKAMHAFAEDDFTMLLPQDYTHTKWVIHGVSQDYKLDSVVIDGRIKLADGDVLADSITGYLPMKAYFSEKNTEEIKPVVSPDGDSVIPHKVMLSGARNGNAMRLPIKWVVKPGVTVNLVVKLVDFLGVELPYPPLDTNVTGIDSCNWDVYPLLPGTYYIRGSINKVSAESIPFVVEPFTVKAEIAVAPDTWQMVSLSDVDESAIMWDDDIAFYYWDETAEYGVAWKYQKYNKGNVVKAQQGVWYNSLEGRPLPLRRNVATGSDTLPGAHVIEWELDSGWNMVANPYGWRVKLPEALPANVRDIYKWSADSAFRPITELQPYEAVWLRSDTKMPFSVNATALFGEAVDAGVLQKAALAKATREGWTLQAVLEDTKGHSDSWNVLGVGEVEERLEPPAGMGDFVNLSVVEGKKALLKSIKSAEDDRYEWKLALRATTDRVGYLKFEGVKALNEIGLRVYVTIDGKTTEMGAGDSLRVMLKSAVSTATVQVTSSEVLTVASNLENLRFERVSGTLQVGFDVSSDLAGAGYRVQLVSINGTVAATYRGKSTAGRNTLALTAPKPGLYLLCVTVGGHHAVRKVAISR